MSKRFSFYPVSTGVALLLAVGCSSADLSTPPSGQMLPVSRAAAVAGGGVPIVLDTMFTAALATVSSVSSDSGAKLKGRYDSLFAVFKATEVSGQNTDAARAAVRGFQVGVVIDVNGVAYVDVAMTNITAGVLEANGRITYAQSKGTNVAQAQGLFNSAYQYMVLATNAPTPAAKLDNATKAGTNVQLIRMLLPAAPATTPTPPPPAQQGLWATIEAPRAWDYQPTAVSQSACNGAGTTYDVGPGYAKTALAQVPWLGLLPCDVVAIHYRALPYKEAIFMSNRGAKNKYIRIVGIPGPNGELPVLEGNGAVMTPNIPVINSVLDGLGLIVVSVPKGYTYGYKPGYFEIANLEIRNANQLYPYTNSLGVTAPWQKFASGIYIERGENIAIRNCVIHGNGNGIFQNSKFDEAGQSRYLLIESNDVYGNGNAGSASEHNAYTEGVGTVYQYNRFGQLATGSYGDNIKERSAGITVRYNAIEGGVHAIALRDPQSNSTWERVQSDAWGNLLVNAAYVYGNTITMRDSPTWNNAWSATVIGFGDGNVSWGNIRGGTLYFYNNTVVSQYDKTQYYHTSTILFEVVNPAPHPVVQARNNVFFAMSHTPGKPATPFAIFYMYGNADFQNNWISSGWLPLEPSAHLANSTLTVNPAWDGSGMAGIVNNAQNNPGFVNVAQDDFHLLAASPLVNAGTSITPQAIATNNALLREYVGPFSSKARMQNGLTDLGAFEW